MTASSDKFDKNRPRVVPAARPLRSRDVAGSTVTPPAPLPPDAPLVRATHRGFYGTNLRPTGQVFRLYSEKDFSPGWMVRVDGSTLDQADLATLAALEALTVSTGAPNPPAAINEVHLSDSTKKKRRTLIKAYCRRREIWQKQFAKNLGMGTDTLDGIVNEQRKRFAVEKQEKLLHALGLTRQQWYAL